MNAIATCPEYTETETATGMKVIFVKTFEDMCRLSGVKQAGMTTLVHERGADGLTINVCLNKLAFNQNLHIPGHKPGCFDIWLSTQYESIEPTNPSILMYILPHQEQGPINR